MVERINSQIEQNERAVTDNIKMSDYLRDQLRELRRSGDELRKLRDTMVGSNPLPPTVQEPPQPQRPDSQLPSSSP